jgi:hypothetical protein
VVIRHLADRAVDREAPIAVTLGADLHRQAALELATRAAFRAGGLDLLELDLASRRAMRHAGELEGRLQHVGLRVAVVDLANQPAADVVGRAQTWRYLLVGIPEAWLEAEGGPRANGEIDPRVAVIAAAAAADTTVLVVRSRVTFERDGLDRMLRAHAGNAKDRPPTVLPS